MAHSKSKTLFVGGLSLAIGEQELKDYFGAFSKVLKVIFLRDHDTGKPRGYAFVTLKDSKVAKHVSQLKHDICGRRVECQLAAKKNEKETNALERTSRKLFITNVPPYLSERAFAEFFSQFGLIHNCYLIKNSEKHCNKGFGFVEFESSEVANSLLEMKMPLEMGKIKLTVHPFKDMKSGKQFQDHWLQASLDNQGNYYHDFLTASYGNSEEIFLNNNICKQKGYKSMGYKKLKSQEQGSMHKDANNLHFHLNSAKHTYFKGNPRAIVLYDPNQGSYSINPVLESSLEHCSKGNGMQFSIEGSTFTLHKDKNCSLPQSLYKFSNIFNRQRDIHNPGWDHPRECDLATNLLLQ